MIAQNTFWNTEYFLDPSLEAAIVDKINKTVKKPGKIGQDEKL